MLSRKEKILLPIGIVALSLSFVLSGFASSRFSSFKKSSGLDHYTLTLDSSKAPSTLTNEYQDSVSGNFTTADGNSISLNFVKAKSANSGLVQLASRGMLFNYASENGGISGISAITVNYTGSTMSLRTSLSNSLSSGTSLTNLYTVSNNTRLELPSPRYFSLLAADGGNTITSMTIEYSCEVNSDINRLNGQYTGSGNDGYTYSLTLNNGSATFTSLDRQDAVSATGTATLNDNSLQCSFTSPSAFNGLTYNFTSDNQSHSLTYVSKSGTGSANAPQINLYRVYKFEDFESYSSAGNGWDNSSGATKYTATGLKGDYVCEYVNSSASSGPIGGQGWSLMGSNDYIVYNANKGHNNSKTLALKGNNNQMRFFQASGYYGIPTVIGKGNKLSFWSKGAYSDSSLTTESPYGTVAVESVSLNASSANLTIGETKTLTATVLPANATDKSVVWSSSNSTVASVNQNGVVTANEVGNATITVTTNDGAKTATCDVTVSQTYPGGTFYNTVHISSYDVKIEVMCTTRAECIVYFYGLKTDGARFISYNPANGAFVIEIDGEANLGALGTYTYGTITGNYVNDELINVGLTGSIKNLLGSVNNTITLPHPTSRFWNANGTTAELQNVFRRRWRNGSAWAFDDSNTNRIEAETTYKTSGSSSVKIRPYASGVGLVLKDSISDGITLDEANTFCAWIYNPSTSAVNFRFFLYKNTDFSSNFEPMGTKTIEAQSWYYLRIGYGDLSSANTVYNFMITNLGANSSATFMVDDVWFHH